MRSMSYAPSSNLSTDWPGLVATSVERPRLLKTRCPMFLLDEFVVVPERVYAVPIAIRRMIQAWQRN
jgi:hypothetical protein